MFTGIIQAVGVISSIEYKGGDVRLTLDCADLKLDSSELGDSIAVNGVCLTAVEYTEQGFVADVSKETLSLTSLGFLKTGSQVNLEKALTMNTALGGHLVSGHVDGIAELIKTHQDGRSMRFEFKVAPSLQHYIAEKGSITIDGTSLTVNQVEQNCFGVNIVPHTLNNTIFGGYQVGTQVNLEVDIIARYLERLLTGKAEQNQSSDLQLLRTLEKSGFIQS